MKLAKKALSVFLSLLMVFGTCSVCLTGLSFSASAATVTTVKNTIAAAASKINSKSAASNAYNYTGDDGTVMAAAEEVYAYTVSLRGGTSSTSSNNSTLALLAKVASNTGYTSGANYNALTRLINPAGTTVVSYEGRKTSTAYHWAGGDHNYPSINADSITKTVNIKATLDSVLCTYDDVNDIPATILLDVTYKYVHASDRMYSHGSYNWLKGYPCTGAKWNYLSSTSRTVNSQNTTAASELQAYAAYFTDARLATKAADLVNKTSTELQANYDEAYAKYTQLTADYSSTVVNHFFDTAAIEAYIGEVEFALQVVLVRPAMQIMLDAMNNGYDNTDIDNMTSVYATAKEAYDIIKDYDQTIFDFVIANYAGFENFSLDASTAFINQLYYDIELYQLRELKAAIDADIAANTDKVSDPLNETDITNLELAALNDKFNGYKASWAQYSAEANAAVFTEGKDYIIEFRALLTEKINTRNADIDYEAYYEYFLPYVYANVADWSKEEIVTRYNEDTAKQSELIASYEKHYGIIGEELVNAVFTMNYNGQDMLLTDVVADYIARLKVVIQDKNNTQLDAVAEYVGTSTEINFSNFVGLKTAINNIDHDLYNSALDNELVDAERKAIYDSLDELLTKYDAFVASGGLADFEQNHYHDENGLFVTRYAGDQRDASGEQLGYVNDIAREGEAENYDVTEDKVNQTIVKLDNFLISEDFCSLVGFEDEEGNAYASLSEAIDDLIQTSLFTDELVNTLIAAIFPMICNLLDETLNDLGALGFDGVTASPDPAAAARLDLDILSKGDFEGVIDLYIDGTYNSKYLIDVFESLGIYLYPQSFAKKVPAKYSETITALKAAGKDWNKFADENGDIVLDFVWGVNDYDSFVSVVGVIFDALLPLLRTLLAGSDYSQKVTNLAYAKAYDMVLKDVLDLYFTKVDIEIISAEAFANITLNIAGENIFKDMWIPVMEVLGVTDGGYDLSALGIAGTYSFKSINSNSSATAIADAMFSPILVIIEQLKHQPLEKVLDILPQLVYTLSFDSIQAMIDAIQIDITAEIEINDFEKLEIIEIFGWEPNFDWLGNLLKGTINGLLPSFDIPLALGDMINLVDMLGFEYTNLNSLLAYVLESTGMGDLSLPIINAGEIISCASLNKNAPSASSAGTRIKLTADRADVFYFLMKYLISAVGDREFLEGLIEYIQTSVSDGGDADTDPDGSAAPAEPFELPEIVYSIINNVNANPMSALAALVELFVPQTYGKEDIDWVTSQYDYAGIDGMNDASIVYLTYGNDWKKADAEHLINNVDAIVESILEMTGSQETSINALIQNAFNDFLTNESMTGIIEGLASLGTALGDEFIYELLDRELEMDLTAMNDAFAYLFVTDEDRAAEGFVEPLKPGDADYENTYAITAETSVNEEGATVITWSYNGTALADGDAETFVDLLCEAIKEFAPLLASFLKGENIGLFNDAIEFLGYENYADSIGIFFELLGIADVMTQAEYEAYCEANGDVAALNFTVKQLFNWVNDYLLEGNTVQKIVELLPNLVYFIESNGISTVIHNLLMPVLVILDTVRPIIDLDLNMIASYAVSDLICYGTVDTDNLLQLISGVAPINLDPDYKYFAIDLGNLTLSTIIPLVDVYFGTKLADSQLVNPGLKSLCSGVVEYDSVIEAKAYKATMDAPDALTILLSSVLEAAEYEVADGKTNGDIICEFIDAQTVADGGEPQAAKIYSAVADLIKGLNIEYTVPDWDYMFTADTQLEDNISLPEHSIVYIGYNTDWTEETAATVDSALNDIVEMILEETADGQTIAQLLNGILKDEVYTDANLTAIVELIVNAIAGLDETLRDLVDVIIDTDIASWFTMCEATVDEEGNTAYVCTKNWGVDAAADAEKKDIFVDGLQEVLAPANELLAWLFFGDSYAFFTGTEKNDDGTYKYNDIITLTGGEGYAYGLVPVLEALGCEMKPASAYENADGTYNVGLAVEDILNSVLAVVDEISGNPATEVFDLLANLIYFINADGIKSSVNNLLAPIDALLEKLAPVISEDGEAVSLGAMLTETVGFDISDLTMDTLLGIAADNGFRINDEMYQLLRTFYIGTLTQYTSANGNYAYRMTYTDEESQHDMLTIVLAFALDAFKLNSELFSDLLGAETYEAVIELLAGAEGMFTYADPNWAYMYEGEDALAQLIANNLPERTGENSIVYTQYTNNWNKATASYLNDNLNSIVKGITDAIRDDGSTVGTLLDKAITKGLYQDAILDSLIEAVVKLLADLDYFLVESVGALLGADVDTWFSYCEITRDADGKVTDVVCTKDWGIDALSTNEAKKEAFVNAFVTALEPANRVLAWLFFGEDYTFFDGTTSEVLITIKGGNGYAEGLVPLLEALGCTMNYDGTDSGIKPVDAYYATGTLDISAAVRDVFTALTDWLCEVCGDLQELENGEGALDVMLDKLPNVVYFVNAGGIKAVVNNLLQPVNFILETLEPMIGEVDLDEMIGFPITELDFYAVFDILIDELGLYFPENVQEFIATFYMGAVEQFTSANGKMAFRMVYDETETRREMITILISIVLDTFADERNEEVLIGWMGEDIYKSIIDVLNITEAKPMQDYSWYYTEYADTDKVFTAIETSGRYSATYNEHWTKDKAQYLADNFEPFVSNILCLLGLEINGVTTDSIEDILDVVISSNLYTQANADAIIAALKDVMAQLSEMEPYGEYIEEVLYNALGVDIHAWDNMTVTVVDGDRETFSAALAAILEPAVPLLELLLVGKDIKLFYTIEGVDSIIIPGSEGYAYGIVPLLEALGCENVLTPDAYKAAIAEDPANAITGIIEPLFDRIDAIEADPVNEIIEMLPAVIYFINSNGLDTSVKNIVNSIDTVLVALEPVVGVTSVVDLLGVDLSTYDFEYLFNMLIEMAVEETGFQLKGIAADAVAELTTGKVVTYNSANGETYYTMQYASERDKADMVTVMLRLIIDFVTMEENLDAIKAILAEYIPDEDNYNSVCSLLDSLAQCAQEDPDMGNALYTLYYIFFALSESAEATDDLYHDVNNSWQFILKMLETSDEPILNSFGSGLKNVLNKYFDGIFDDEGVASDGALTFFERIAAFFEKIAAFFRKLFGME